MPQAVVAVATWIGNTVAAWAASAGATAAVSTTVAAAVTTVSQIALTVGMQYAIDSISQPNIKPAGSELSTNIDPAYPREMVIGERQVGGSLIARYSRDVNNYFAHVVIQVADHPCVELSKIYDGGRLVQGSPLAHGVRTEITAYSNSGGPRLWMTWHDGRPGQTADSDLVTKSATDPEVVAGKIDAWTSDHRGAGCAYVHIEMRWDPDILTSIPQFTFLLKGAKLYDRRKDTTAGGSGTHRLDDPSTWEYSTNAMVALDHYLLGYQVEDDPLAFGIGLSTVEVPYAQFAAAADLCDEDVETGTGATIETIKRYAANGVISAGDYFLEVIEALQVQMAARVVDLGGRIGILGAEERAITVSLTEDDLVKGEPLQFADKLAFADLIGSVTGTFSDPANNYQPTPYDPLYTAYRELPDGGEAQAVSLSFPYEVHPRRAARLVSAWAARETLQPRLAGMFLPKAWKLEPGDWFEFTSPRLQITDAKFEVIDIVKNDDFTVAITARAIDPDFLAFDNDNDPALSVPPDIDPADRKLEIPTFTPSASTISGGGAVEPVISIEADDLSPVAREIVYEVREWDGADFTGPSIFFVAHADEPLSLLRQGIKPGADYKVRMKVRAGTRESDWSDWSSVVSIGAAYTVPLAGAAESAASGSDLEAAIAAAATSSDAAAAAAAASASAAAADALTAAGAATSASGSATAAAGSATSASNSATTAAGSATSAASSASAAAASATAASGSASAASTSASAANTSATNAGTSASAAAASAVTASTQATNSASSASAAATSASNASSSASGAATSASAAATSATTATTQASNAGTSASSASTSAGAAASSATTASTQASNAASSASSASSSASSASASASAASSSASLAASFGGPASINTSATFADNANATGVPTNWVDWSNGSGTRVTGLAPQPFAVTITGGAGTENGIYQSLLGRISTGWHVIEVDVTLVSGAFTAAGAYLDWDGGGTGISFVSDLDVNGVAPGIGTTGRLYKFRKLVQATAGTTYGNLYAMSHWSGFGSNASANSITWHRCAVRAASQAEIEARQATTDLVTTNANVATNTSVIATNTSAITTHSSQLSAMYGGYNSNLVPNSNFARGMEGWTGYAGGFVQGGPDPSVGIYSYSAANGAYVQSAEFPVYASGVVTFSLNAGGANLVGAYAVIAYYNSSHAFISHGTFITITTGIGYPRYTLTDTAPSGAAYARVQVGDTSHTSGFFLFYKVKVENGSTATPWTDERTPEGISAAVVTNTSAVATINDAAAFWETIVSAGGGDLAAVRLKAGTGGSYIELISTVLRLANVSNGAVIEVMRAVSGEAFFSRPISSDSASRRLTIGPGYGVSGQEVVLWFGPVATAPSSQSRTNGYFALGTDGKIYFGSADAGVATAPLTVSFSPTSVNTTHTTNTPLSQAITATPAGGSGTYTYVWALGDILSGNTPTLTNRYSATVTLGCTHTAVGTIDGNISCTVTDTVTGKSVTKYFGYYSEGTGGGTGAGAGGGLPP